VPEINEPIGSEAPNGISRRTVTKAMAWAVPVIAVATAVPAYAASQGEFNLTGLGCKLPGRSNPTFKGYAFRLSVSNTTDQDIIIEITEATLKNQDLGQVGVINLLTGTLATNPFTATANTTYPSLVLITENAPNSTNGVLSVTYTIDGGVTFTTVTATVPSAPPINGASCSVFTTDEKITINSALGPTPVWESGITYAEGDIVTVAGGIWVASNDGTSGATFPVPGVTPLPPVGGTVDDNGIIWTRVQ
jgi:hypothetical protein